MIPISIAALVCAALFTGAAGYISLVEHPARLGLDDAPLLAQWQPSYGRALPLQSGLAVAGGLAGLAAWYLSGAGLWLAGSVALLANWPFTFLAIMPINRRLKVISPAEAGPASRKLLVTWGKRHHVRSGLGLAAMILFALALAEIR